MTVSNPFYRLNPVAGSPTPIDVGSGLLGTLTGGAIALVDTGGGVWAWQFSGGDATVAVPANHVVGGNFSANSCVIAVRMAVPVETTGFSGYVGLIPTGGSALDGFSIIRTGAGALACTLAAQGSGAQMGPVDSTLRTYVIRLSSRDAARGGSDYLETWHTGGSGSGNNPDDTSGPVIWGTGSTGSILKIFASIATIQIVDLAVWYEILPNADCRAIVANGFDAALAPAPIAFSGPVPAQFGTAISAQTTLPLAGFFSAGTTPYTYTVSAGALPSGWSLASGTGIVTRGASTAGSYAFTVTATDAAAATAASNSIAVTINAALTISTQPASTSVTSGATASFSYVSAGGTAPVTQQWKRNGTNAVTTAGLTTAATTVTGGSANNGDLYSVVITDAAGATVTSSNATLTVTASSDVTPPTQTGSVTSSAITQTTYTLAWPAGADNVAVTGYEYSTNAGTTYTAVGNVLTTNVTGRTAGATDAVRVRAFDAAGNRSTPALSAAVTLLVSSTPRILLTANPADQFRAEGSNALMASKTGTVWISNPTTGALVVTKAFTTDASGLAGTITDAALALSTAYRIAFEFSTGEHGVIKRTSEAT